MRIPRTMSTQHPDNVQHAPFSKNSVIAGDDEITEAYYSYASLHITEQLWDFEGKDADNAVVRKLLSQHEEFFRRKKLGMDVFLTYRVPNPTVEKSEGKILLETLESIPRSSDVARVFYGEEIVPVFEVCIPMITSPKCLRRVAQYYKQIVVAKEKKVLFAGDRPLSSWVGSFFPKEIRVVPLIEDMPSLLQADRIVEEFVKKEKIKEYQRVWLARSDPALNYGSVSTVLIEKIALQKIFDLSEKISLPLHPILGCGSAPFRGNFNPKNVKENMTEYPSVQTFTLQSAFKYDYDEKIVKEAVEHIENTKSKKPIFVEEQSLLPIIDKIAQVYEQQIHLLAPLINQFSKYIPARRKRKLHIGLFGYARTGKGVSLPRAITFCASLYSLGLPPELLGLSTLSEKEIGIIKNIYPSFENDLQDATQLLNKGNLAFFPKEIAVQVQKASALVETKVHEEHKKDTTLIMNAFRKNKSVPASLIVHASKLRGYLG